MLTEKDSWDIHDWRGKRLAQRFQLGGRLGVRKSIHRPGSMRRSERHSLGVRTPSPKQSSGHLNHVFSLSHALTVDMFFRVEQYFESLNRATVVQTATPIEYVEVT